MAEHTLYGKSLICKTDIAKFTDFQGIGREPLYKRYDSVFSVVEKIIDSKYRDFLAHPIYDKDEDIIKWYASDWNSTPCLLEKLPEGEQAKYNSIKDETISIYRSALSKLVDEDKLILSSALKYIEDDFIFCFDNKVVLVAWGMASDSNNHELSGPAIYDLPSAETIKIKFEPGENGYFINKLDSIIKRPKGFTLSLNDLPKIVAKEGFTFKQWDPEPIGMKVRGPLIFSAIYDIAPKADPLPSEQRKEKVKITFIAGLGGSLDGETAIEINKGSTIPLDLIPKPLPEPNYSFNKWNANLEGEFYNDTIVNALFNSKGVRCSFNSNTNGTIEGAESFILPHGDKIPIDKIPSIKPKKGYLFKGWDKSPIDYTATEDVVFNALYEKKIPWYKKAWEWFKGKGCLKWLLWLLLFMLLLFLLSFLLRSCDNDSISNKVYPIEQITTPSGSIIDNNGPVKGIIGDDGKLPSNNIVSPIIGDDGMPPPISSQPGEPSIIINRLNIYFEDANVDLERFVGDLSKIYSENSCKVIGLDRNIPMIQILIQESERDYIRENLNNQLPDYKFFIVDESIFTYFDTNKRYAVDEKGWHLSAINLKKAWEITKGDPNIVVAVVDDGIDPMHDMFKDRIVKPYNVFTQTNTLSTGKGHGTHVAGLAVGSDDLYDKGISGVAPNCKLMPVQVFDNDICTFSSITNGIMYAIHNGANVVNVSVGPSLSGFDILPLPAQEQIAQTKFKNEELVWRRIINVANKNNVIIVFAVGNDNIIASIPPENRFDSTVNVAAVNSSMEGTDFTNYGKGAHVSAPGENIISSIPSNKYEVYNGTSMAAPIVSGAIALMKSCNSDIKIDDILPILQKTGVSISKYVPPMIQVDKALIAVTTGNIPENNSAINDSSNDDIIRKEIEAKRRKIRELEQEIEDLSKQLTEKM